MFRFAAMMRNAITYLASKPSVDITIRLHFGSVFGTNEDVNRIADYLTEDWANHGANNSKIDLYVTTYRKSTGNWNHGKIIAIDGDKLFTVCVKPVFHECFFLSAYLF